MGNFDYKEFIRRTIKALTQYEDYIKEHPQEQSYSRTLFINACVGLLMIPHEEKIKSFPNCSVKDWGINEDKIKLEKDKSISKITTHLRNSVAHSRFEYNCKEESVPIEEIIFTDKYKNSDSDNFEAVLDYETFKNFVFHIAKFTLEH